VLAVVRAGCSGLNALNPVCRIGSLGGSVVSSGFQSVLSGISQWVTRGAEWLLAQIGTVLSSTTTVDVGASWFRSHYATMTWLAGLVVLPLLLVSTLQAILRQDAGQLVRAFLFRLPMALLLSGVAIQLVVLALAITDSLSDAVAGGTGGDVTTLLSGVTSGLVTTARDPSIAGFVLLLLGLLLAVGAFVLWIELLIRSAAVYVAVLFLPLAMAALVWPAVSHWCRRLVETLAALILSKFVIVAVLSLAAGALASGTAGTGLHGAGFSSVLAGGALLLMATFVPFAILRLIPAVEAGAVGHLEGLRSRMTAPMVQAARTAASVALHAGLDAMGDAQLMASSSFGGEDSGGGGGGAAGRGASSGGVRAAGARAHGAEPVGVGPDTQPDDVVGPNGETYQELLDQVTPENGGLIADAAGRFIGDPSSQRVLEEALAEGVQPGPRGPKPVMRPAGAAPYTPLTWSSPRQTGPERPEDAWKWQGVPPGCSLVGPIEPGRKRHYRDMDDHGPVVRWLPPSWPPGHPDAGKEDS
jgi:hypothetical protein